MELNLVDPFDFNIRYNPFDTVVVGYADPSKRAESIVYFSQTAHVFDLYRDPALLLPLAIEIECFFRFLDADTYFAIEEQIVAHVALDDPTPTVVYGLGENMLHESPYIINGDKTLPAMIDCFYDYCRRR